MPPSHGGNRGSIPLSATLEKSPRFLILKGFWGFFYARKIEKICKKFAKSEIYIGISNSIPFLACLVRQEHRIFYRRKIGGL